MQELEKIIEKMKEIKDGNRKEKLYTKYPPNSKDQEVLNAYSQGYEDGTDNFYNAIVDDVRNHINDGWIPDKEVPSNRWTEGDEDSDGYTLDRFDGIYTVYDPDGRCIAEFAHYEYSGWIPAEERLPEDVDEEYYAMNIVTLENGSVCLGVYRNNDGEWWTRMNEGGKYYTNSNKVIAWMPLPEPYEPETQDKPEEHFPEWRTKFLGKFDKRV